MRTSLLALIAAGCLGAPSGLPTAVPTLTPTSFATSTISSVGGTPAGSHHSLALQPQQSTMLFGAGWQERPSLQVDIVNDHQMDDGQDLVVTAAVSHGDPAKGAVHVVWTLVGDTSIVTGTSYVRAKSPAAPLGNGSAYGYQCRLSVPSATNDRVMFLFVEAIPTNGRSQMIVRRILVKGSARIPLGASSGSASTLYVSPVSTASDASGYGTAAKPYKTLLYALSKSTSGGVIYMDCANGPHLIDTSLSGAAPNNADYVQVRPWSGTGSMWTLSSTSPIRTNSSAAGNSSAMPGNTALMAVKTILFNGAIDTSKLGWFSIPTSGTLTYGPGLVLVDCIPSDPKAAAGDHFYYSSLYQNNSLLSINAPKTGLRTDGVPLSYELAFINCTGTLISTAAATLKVGCSFENAWDIGNFPDRSESSFGMLSSREKQNRLFFTTYNCAENGGVPITSVATDPINERAIFGVGLETFSGVAKIAVDSNHTATVSTFRSDGTTALAVPFFVCGTNAEAVNNFSPATVVFDNGPLAGQPLTVATIGSGSSFTITDTGLDQQTQSTATYTFKFQCFPDVDAYWNQALNSSGSDGMQIRIMSGAAKSTYSPIDVGSGSKVGDHCTADYTAPENVLKDSFAHIMAGSGFYSHAIPAPPLSQPAPLITTSGKSLTAAGTATAGSGSLTSTVDPVSGATYVTAPNGLPAALVWGSTVVATLTDGSTVTMRVARNINRSTSASATVYADAVRSAGTSMSLPANSFFVVGALAKALSGANVASWTVAWNNHGLAPGSTIQVGGTFVSLTACSNSIPGSFRTLTFASLPPGFPTSGTVVIQGQVATIQSISGNAVTFKGPVLVQGYQKFLSDKSIADLGQVQVGGQLLTVQSVSGATATLVAAPSTDITQATAYSHFIGKVPQVVVQCRFTDDFGNSITPVLPNTGDTFHITNTIQHYDWWQFQSFKSQLPRLTNCVIANSTVQGNNLQSLQADAQPTLTVGSLNYTAGSLTQTFNLPTLSIASILNGSAVTYYVNGQAFSGYQFTATYSGSGAAIFPWVNPARPIRVLFKSGTYAGKSFRLYSQSALGTTATFILLDDQNVVSGGTWAGAANDNFQHPLPLSDGDMFVVGAGSSASPHQNRIWTNDPVNVGSGTIDKVFFSQVAGGASVTTFGTPATVSYFVPAVMQDVQYLGSFIGYGLPGQKLTLNNPLLGALSATCAARNFGWTQSTYMVGEDPQMTTPWQVKQGTLRRFSIIDSLHAGFEVLNPNTSDKIIADADDVSVVNSLLASTSAYTSYAPNPWVPPAGIINTSLLVNATTLTPSVSSGPAIPSIPQGTLASAVDSLGNAVNDNGAGMVGAKQAS